MNSRFPTEREYINWLINHEAKNTTQHDKVLDDFEFAKDLDLLGTSLSFLIRYSTCHFVCKGGNHIMESYCGRAYNLAFSAFILIRKGLYDESFNCIRSLGEIANIIFLFNKDYPKSFKKWLLLSEEKRRKEFSPNSVRNKIKNLGLESFTPMKSDEYWNLCEQSTHIVPHTIPNKYNHDDKGTVGGILQKDGIKKALSHLALLTAAVTILFGESFNRPQDHNEILKNIT